MPARQRRRDASGKLNARSQSSGSDRDEERGRRTTRRVRACARPCAAASVSSRTARSSSAWPSPTSCRSGFSCHGRRITTSPPQSPPETPSAPAAARTVVACRTRDDRATAERRSPRGISNRTAPRRRRSLPCPRLAGHLLRRIYRGVPITIPVTVSPVADRAIRPSSGRARPKSSASRRGP